MLKLLALLAVAGLVSAHNAAGRRGGGRRLLGGWGPVNVTNEGVIAAAEYAVGQIQSRSNGMYALKLGEIVSAEKQIVSGIQYRMTLNVLTTNCRVSPTPADLSTCTATQTQQCVVHVLHKAWGPTPGHSQGRSAPQCSAITDLPGSE